MTEKEKRVLEEAIKIQQNQIEIENYKSSLKETLAHNNSQPFVVCKTTNALAVCGAKKELDIMITPRVISKCMADESEHYHGHNLSQDIIVNLPEQLSTPVMVFKGSKNKSLVVITDLEDEESKEILIAISLEDTIGFKEVNRVSSVYGKDNMSNYLKRQIAEHNLLAVNIEKANEMLHSAGVQFPMENTFISFDNSIAYSMENVKYPLTEKERKFMEIDLAAEIASQSLAWDEVENLGYIMLEEGHRQKFKPSSIASYGLGGLHEPDLFVLLDRKEQGEDITRELVLGLSGLNVKNMIMGVRSDPNNLYSEQFRIDPDQRWETENGYMLKYGKAEKEVTYKEIEEAYMKRITDEWKRLNSYEEEEKVEYEYIRSKSVQDSDGFMTDYTMYRQKGTDKYVFVYGDNDVYSADDGNFDYECEGETHANEWFNSYGEEEEQDEKEDKSLDSFFVRTYSSLYLDTPSKFIGQHLTQDEAFSVFLKNIKKDPDTMLFMSFKGAELMTYNDKGLNEIDLNFHSIKLAQKFSPNHYNELNEDDIEELYQELADFRTSFERANTKETIADYLSFSKREMVISEDVDYNGCIPLSYYNEDEYDMSRPYDHFVRFLYENVRVIHSNNFSDPPTVLCDWTGFICENHEALQDFLHMADSQHNFIYGWYSELNRMLAGEVTESTYRHFMEVMKEHSREPELSNEYMVYLRDELIPYALPENEKGYRAILNGEKPREIKGLYPYDDDDVSDGGLGGLGAAREITNNLAIVSNYLKKNNYNATVEDVERITERFLANMNSGSADNIDSLACLESAVNGYYQDQEEKRATLTVSRGRGR